MIQNEQVAEVATPTTTTVGNTEDFKFGYVVGLTKEGKLVFHAFGEDAGLIQIMGAHAYASERVEGLYDLSQRTGDAISLEILKTLRSALVPQQSLDNPGEEKGGE